MLGSPRLAMIVLAAMAAAASACVHPKPTPVSPAEGSWRARRLDDSLCATYPLTRSRAAPHRTVRRDPVTGRECSAFPGLTTLTAVVLGNRLVGPSVTPWNDTNLLALLDPRRIDSLIIRRDSVAFARWHCPRPVDAVLRIVAKASSLH